MKRQELLKHKAEQRSMANTCDTSSGGGTRSSGGGGITSRKGPTGFSKRGSVTAR